MKIGKVEYWIDSHGARRRVQPKRDKSVSARQAKKAAKAERRSATPTR